MAGRYSADSDLEEDEEEEEIEEIEESEESAESETVNSSQPYCDSGESQEIGQSKKPSEEAGEEEVDKDGEDKVLGVPRDGGKLLFGYKHSWAATIYSTEDHRNACRFLRAQPTLSAKNKWNLDTEADVVVALVKESGLFTAVGNSVVKYDAPLVSAFSERYYAETDTMHFPFGEMTLTPDDVHHILGLNVEGKAVNEGYMKKLDWDELYALTMKVFDWDLEMAKSELMLGKGRARVFNLKRLRSKFEGTKDLESKGELTEKRIIATTTAYLMYILGRVIFPDTSGSRVKANYLQLLDPLNRVSSYSWGTACLSFLMNELRKTSRLQKKQIGGNMGLLQVWIYVHFPSLRSRVSTKNGRYPIGRRYMLKGKRKSKKLDLIALREELDQMGAKDVTFDPYNEAVAKCKISRTNEQGYFGPLFHPNGYIMYNPTRVWRQLGYVQDIPFDSFHNHWSLKLADCKSSRDNIVVVHDPIPSSADWEKRDQFHLPAGYPVSQGDEVSPTYMEWYRKVSHPQVIRIDPGTSKPVHTIEELSKKIEIEGMKRHISQDRSDSNDLKRTKSSGHGAEAPRPSVSSSSKKMVLMPTPITDPNIPQFGHEIRQDELVNNGEGYMLVYGFWVACNHGTRYAQIVKDHGHIPIWGSIPLGVSLVSFVNGLLDVVAGMEDESAAPHSANRLSDWRSLIDSAAALGFNVQWLSDKLTALELGTSNRRAELSQLIEEARSRIQEHEARIITLGTGQTQLIEEARSRIQEHEARLITLGTEQTRLSISITTEKYALAEATSQLRELVTELESLP